MSSTGSEGIFRSVERPSRVLRDRKNVPAYQEKSIQETSRKGRAASNTGAKQKASVKPRANQGGKNMNLRKGKGEIKTSVQGRQTGQKGRTVGNASISSIESSRHEAPLTFNFSELEKYSLVISGSSPMVENLDSPPIEPAPMSLEKIAKIRRATMTSTPHVNRNDKLYKCDVYKQICDSDLSHIDVVENSPALPSEVGLSRNHNLQGDSMHSVMETSNVGVENSQDPHLQGCQVVLSRLGAQESRENAAKKPSKLVALTPSSAVQLGIPCVAVDASACSMCSSAVDNPSAWSSVLDPSACSSVLDAPGGDGHVSHDQDFSFVTDRSHRQTKFIFSFSALHTPVYNHIAQPAAHNTEDDDCVSARNMATCSEKLHALCNSQADLPLSNPNASNANSGDFLLSVADSLHGNSSCSNVLDNCVQAVGDGAASSRQKNDNGLYHMCTTSSCPVSELCNHGNTVTTSTASYRTCTSQYDPSQSLFDNSDVSHYGGSSSSDSDQPRVGSPRCQPQAHSVCPSAYAADQLSHEDEHDKLFASDSSVKADKSRVSMEIEDELSDIVEEEDDEEEQQSSSEDSQEEMEESDTSELSGQRFSKGSLSSDGDTKYMLAASFSDKEKQDASQDLSVIVVDDSAVDMLSESICGVHLDTSQEAMSTSFHTCNSMPAVPSSVEATPFSGRRTSKTAFQTPSRPRLMSVMEDLNTSCRSLKVRPLASCLYRCIYHVYM